MRDSEGDDGTVFVGRVWAGSWTGIGNARSGRRVGLRQTDVDGDVIHTKSSTGVRIDERTRGRHER